MSPTLQRAALHEHGADRAAAALELGLDHDAFGGAVGVGLELEQLGLQEDRLEQLVEVGPLHRRDLDLERLARHALDDDLVLQRARCARGWDRRCGLSILLMATMIGTPAALAWLIASTVCGMTPSSAATTSTTMSVTLAPRARMAVNASWPGVSMKVIFWPSARRHLVGADVLRDAAGLAARDVGVADGVEQRRLAVVDVAHDGDDGRARLQVLARSPWRR